VAAILENGVYKPSDTLAEVALSKLLCLVFLRFQPYITVSLKLPREYIIVPGLILWLASPDRGILSHLIQVFKSIGTIKKLLFSHYEQYIYIKLLSA